MTQAGPRHVPLTRLDALGFTRAGSRILRVDVFYRLRVCRIQRPGFHDNNEREPTPRLVSKTTLFDTMVDTLLRGSTRRASTTNRTGRILTDCEGLRFVRHTQDVINHVLTDVQTGSAKRLRGGTNGLEMARLLGDDENTERADH